MTAHRESDDGRFTESGVLTPMKLADSQSDSKGKWIIGVLVVFAMIAALLGYAQNKATVGLNTTAPSAATTGAAPSTPGSPPLQR